MDTLLPQRSGRVWEALVRPTTLKTPVLPSSACCSRPPAPCTGRATGAEGGDVRGRLSQAARTSDIERVVTVAAARPHCGPWGEGAGPAPTAQPFCTALLRQCWEDFPSHDSAAQPEKMPRGRGFRARDVHPNMILIRKSGQLGTVSGNGGGDHVSALRTHDRVWSFGSSDLSDLPLAQRSVCVVHTH